MPEAVIKRKDKRVHMPSFGCVRALLFIDGGGSAEIAMAPLEMSRLPSAWEEVESARKSPNEPVLAALRLLIPKTRTLAPDFLTEVPIARTKRVLLTPDFESSGKAITAKVKQKHATQERVKGLSVLFAQRLEYPHHGALKLRGDTGFVFEDLIDYSDPGLEGRAQAGFFLLQR